MTQSPEDKDLDRITGFLEEEGLIAIRQESWGLGGGAAVLAHRDGWETVVAISVEGPEDRSRVVCFWAPILEAIGSDSDGDYPEDEQELSRILDQAEREVARLNEGQQVGRWVFKPEWNRITLEHELPTDEPTKEQLIETVETLGRDSSVWKSLQASLGGISGLQQMEEARKAAEIMREAIEGAKGREPPA